MSVIKPVEFLGSSLDDLREFPLVARREAGYQLDRVLYVAKFESLVYVLHCFQKKTPQTRLSDIEIARQR